MKGPTKTVSRIATKYPTGHNENLGFGYRTEKKYKFRTIRAKSINVGSTTDIWVASDFTIR